MAGHSHLDWTDATKEQKTRWQACPLRTLRLPELANGDFLRMLKPLFDIGIAALVERLLPELQQGVEHTGVQGSCLQEFERDRSTLVFELTIKTAGYMEPPCRLFACAHHSETAQMQALRICLNTSSSRHPRILELQTQPLSGQSEAVLSGVKAVENCAELALFIAELKFG